MVVFSLSERVGTEECPDEHTATPGCEPSVTVLLC